MAPRPARASGEGAETEELEDDREHRDEIREFLAREGRKTLQTLSKRERNPSVRRKALRVYGHACMICGFDFEEVYGPDFKECVQIHHLDPLAEREAGGATRA